MLLGIVALLFGGAALVAVAPSARADSVGSEPYRPAIHFSPAQNWMNDPNGLVYYRGEYHLFFQYNPAGNQWGNMSWGHAVSPDLVHWTQLPVAIADDDQNMAFSGSVVIDYDNTTGFGQPGNPAMVAIYTAASNVDGYQRQAIAYSLDDGRTFTKAGIVLPTPDPQDPNASPSDNFRDPKVFWYAAGHEWIMVAALSALHQVVFFSSPDLKQWTRLSAFGPAHATGGVWECPDLFPLPDPAHPGQQKWVLVVNLNPGGVAGGSGAQYFIGNFDGTTFTADGVPYVAPGGTSLGDFDDGTFDGWTPTGASFGSAPAAGALPGQLPVTGFLGAGLVNGFNGGDASTGTLSSPDFVIDHAYLNFLIGGGDHPYIPGSTPGGNAAGTTFADFEGPTFGAGWTATGDFANAGPAAGSLPGQQQVSGFDGAGLVNTFTNGDAAQGTISSPSFVIGSHFVNLLVGGGDHPWGQANPTSVNLVVNGQVVDSATGQDSESLNWVSWDVSQYQGQSATVQIVDQNSSGWGHLLADSITFAAQPASPIAADTSVRLVVNGQVVRSATGANSETLDWANFSVADLEGQTAHLELVDNNTTTGEGAWGHLLADQFELSDSAAVPQAQQTDWLDFGADDYAATTYNNAPGGQRIMIGWMNDWNYGGDVPTSPWRSAMTLPRTLSLVQTSGGLRLAQRPVTQVDALAGAASFQESNVDVSGTTTLPDSAAGTVQRIDVSFAPGSAAQSGLTVFGDASTSTTIGYDSATGSVYVDRTNSGLTSFNSSFPVVTSAPVELDPNGELNLTIYLDRSSVEVFTEDGTRALTDTVFPDPGAASVTLFANGGVAHLDSLTVSPLAPAMFETPFDAVGSPSITGTQTVGSTLTATTGTWSPQPATFSYQWSADGVDVAGATGPTFVPTAAQAGEYLTVTVTGLADGNEPTTSVSAPAGPIGDSSAPRFTTVPASPVLATATSTAGAVVSYPALTAVDDVDPDPTVACDHASGAQYPLGDTVVTCTATDEAQNQSTVHFTVRVTYAWSGVGQPINAKGNSVFTVGPTIPVTFALTGASSAVVNATAHLSYVKTSDRVSGRVIETKISTAAPTKGSVFRYDAVTKRYVFHWATQSLTTGTYLLTIDLGDGVTRTVQLSLQQAQ